MEKKRQITFYSDLNGPHQDQIRRYALMTPEERWEEYIRLRRLFLQFKTGSPKKDRRISFSKPPWM